MLLNDSIFVIAEIGINHNGDINIAKELIDMAKQAECDAVKFQKRTIDIVYTPEVLNTPRESPWGNTTKAQKEGLEFGQKEYDEINNYCKKNDIEWFASAWDIPSQDFLSRYNFKHNKIASAMLTHLDFINRVASEKKETFISTGMSTYENIDKAVEIFNKYDCPFVLMHTVSTYPCKDDECNLQMIKTLQERYECKVGYSGHEVGAFPSIYAAVLGAVAIERHITLDRSMYGSDQSASLEKKGLELIVRECKEMKNILGSGEKTISEDEQKVANKLRYFMGNI